MSPICPPLPLYPTNLCSVCSVTAHLARLEGGGDLGPAPATAALLGLLRDVMAGAGHSVVEVSCDWSHQSAAELSLVRTPRRTWRPSSAAAATRWWRSCSWWRRSCPAVTAPCSSPTTCTSSAPRFPSTRYCHPAHIRFLTRLSCLLELSTNLPSPKKARPTNTRALSLLKGPTCDN